MNTTPKPRPLMSRTPSFTPQQHHSTYLNNNDIIRSAGVQRRTTNIRKPSPLRQNRSAEAPAILKSNGNTTRTNSIPRINGNNGNYLNGSNGGGASKEGLKQQIPLVRPNQTVPGESIVYGIL